MMLDCQDCVALVHCLSDRFIERDWRDKQKVVDGLRDTVEKQKRDLDSVRKEIMEKEMLCSALRVCCLFCGLNPFSKPTPIVSIMYLCIFFFGFSQKQMTYLETQQNEAQAAKDEARRLRTKLKTFERYLQS